MFLTRRFYIAITVIIFLLCGGYIFGSLFVAGQLGLFLLVLAAVSDGVSLYRMRGITAFRECGERFSNGDDNAVVIHVDSTYPFAVELVVVDEIPPVFQLRNVNFRSSLRPGEGIRLLYWLRATSRGVYNFGLIRVFVTTRLGLVSRRISCGAPQDVKVYPSYLQLRRYELLAMSNQLTESGLKRIRRVGHQTEFEQIKEYVKGDDYRTINWKASARRHQLMVNVYQDERSQQVYSLIDKGRVMQQAFAGMTLLDYAINASLVLSYVGIHRGDKAGLATFHKDFDSFVPASKQAGQMQILLENLYKQQTTFGETDFSALCVHLGKHVAKRSLMVLYTNFSNRDGMVRQLPYLRQLARQHCLLVVFFEDVELNTYLAQHPTDTEEYYRHVIAEKFAFEKRLIVSTLKQHGIYSLLTTPDNLTVDVVNKYLEMKSRQLI